ncbi:alpha/beta hydrolase [Vibrio fluvialis]
MKSHSETAMADNAEKAPNEARRDVLKLTGAGLVALGVGTMTSSKAIAQSELKLSDEWDKTFAKSDKIDHQKVTFKNRYGITLAADLYQPKNASGKLAALVLSGPFGAVKEQSSGLYAQTMAERGFHPRAINSNASWTVTTPLSFMNMSILTYIAEISPRPVLFIHGEKAHSRYFSETAYEAAAEPKELMILPGANHTDLYDQMDVIPFDKITAFFQQHLA